MPRIITNPAKWPKDTYNGRGTYNHIFYDQATQPGGKNPPEAALKDALRRLEMCRPRIDSSTTGWWQSLTDFHPQLRGWKLVGRGDMPTSILNPNEKPHRGDKKLQYAPPKETPPATTVMPSKTVPTTPKKTSAELGAKILGDLMVDPTPHSQASELDADVWDSEHRKGKP